MIVAIYARKSTEQAGVADEQKSVTRQVEHARAFAAAKGWTIDEASVYVDDGISGAEFATRPGFLRLMNALKPRPRFSVLIMSEVSRLGREQVETAYALKQLSVAGVRCFSYLEGRELLMESATDKFLLGAVTFAADLEREKARQRTADAMSRKARAGHVTGGRVFGYDNVPVMVISADGLARRSHVERTINDTEAAVIRRIFELTAQGRGKTTVAKLLNAVGAPAPRSQQGRPRAWSPSSVHEALYRPLYRGALVYNRTQKRNQWGQHAQHARPEQEWIRRDAPALRIVSEELWAAAHRYLDDARAKYLRGTDGRLWGRPSGTESKYLLPGFARCACCNGVMHVRTRAHGRRRVAFYGCTSYWKRGRTVCENRLEVPMEGTDRELLDAIATQVLSADVVEEIIARAAASASVTSPETAFEQLKADQAAVDVEIGRYVEAIGRGGDVPELLAALKARRARRTDLARAIAAASRQGAMRTDGVLLDEIRRRVTSWRELMMRHTTQARQILRKMLRGRPIRFEPAEQDGRRGYRFTGEASITALLTGLISHPLSVASPMPASWNQIVAWLKQIDTVRVAA